MIDACQRKQGNTHKLHTYMSGLAQTVVEAETRAMRETIIFLSTLTLIYEACSSN